jgi:hypothetical protein
MVAITLTDLLRTNETFFTDRGTQRDFRSPPLWDVTAYEYLKWALEDLSEGNSERNRINSLSNIKKALHRRVDTLIKYLWLKPETKYFPSKLSTLKNVDVFIPGIIDRINRNRNLSEHEYIAAPDIEDIEESIVITEFFLKSTDYLMSTPSKFVNDRLGISMCFNLEDENITVLQNGDNKMLIFETREDREYFAKLLLTERQLLALRFKQMGYVEQEKKIEEIRLEYVKNITHED